MNSECFDLIVLSCVLGLLFLLAIGGLCVHIRNAVIGARLLEACAGDYQSAAIAIENVRAENEFLDQAIADSMNRDRNPYRLRLARFNEDTQ